MRPEALTPFDVHIHPRADGGVELLASAGRAGVWGQAHASTSASDLARLERVRKKLDRVDEDSGTPLAGKRRVLDFAWCRVHGANVFRALLPGAVEDLYRGCLRQARREGLTLMLRIRYSGTAERLHEAPWELVFDPDEDQFLALWPETCLARYLQMPRAERPVRHDPRTLLVTMANARSHPLMLGKECERIGAVTRRTMRLTSSRVTSNREIRAQLVNAAGAGRPYLAWHHVGHGEIDAATGRFELAFDTGHRDKADASLADLVAALAGSHVRCAVLNICHSGGPTGVATAIAAANVPIVIGHRTAVYDDAAISFATTLWRELVAGRPAELAIRTARVAMVSQGGSHWVLPMLFVRTDDTYLVEEPV
jgi:hypothetical protein